MGTCPASIVTRAAGSLILSVVCQTSRKHYFAVLWQ